MSNSYKKLFNNSEGSTTTIDELDAGNEMSREKSPLTNNIPSTTTNMSPDWNYGTWKNPEATSTATAGNGNTRDRAVSKKGFSNLTAANIEKNNWAFFEDIFTTFLEVKWRWLMFTFCFVYFSSWLVFAGVWWLILLNNGDLTWNKITSPIHIPCITNIDNFATAFLFSVETMQTTGYGFYHITDECPSAIIMLCVQSIFGIIIEGLMVGLVFVKIGRAKKRSATLMFSRNAVISQRDGKLCFIFRIADMRNKSHLLDARIRAQFVGKRTTLEGEEISISQQELEVHGEGEKRNRLLLLWPTTVIHVIDESSPLLSITIDDLNERNVNFEIVVVLEGIVEATGLMTQARSSFMPSEILWNHRFKNITSTKSPKTGDKVLDYRNFNETYPVSL